MSISEDFTIDFSTNSVRYVGHPSNSYTLEELLYHIWVDLGNDEKEFEYPMEDRQYE